MNRYSLHWCRRGTHQWRRNASTATLPAWIGAVLKNPAVILGMRFLR